MPSCQISRLRQSGHHLRLASAAPFSARGANTKTASAMIATGTLQNTKPHCQLPPTSGSTSISMKATGRISPTSRPLV